MDNFNNTTNNEYTNEPNQSGNHENTNNNTEATRRPIDFHISPLGFNAKKTEPGLGFGNSANQQNGANNYSHNAMLNNSYAQGGTPNNSFNAAQGNTYNQSPAQNGFNQASSSNGFNQTSQNNGGYAPRTNGFFGAQNNQFNQSSANQPSFSQPREPEVRSYNRNTTGSSEPQVRTYGATRSEQMPSEPTTRSYTAPVNSAASFAMPKPNILGGFSTTQQNRSEFTPNRQNDAFVNNQAQAPSNFTQAQPFSQPMQGQPSHSFNQPQNQSAQVFTPTQNQNAQAFTPTQGTQQAQQPIQNNAQLAQQPMQNQAAQAFSQPQVRPQTMQPMQSTQQAAMPFAQQPTHQPTQQSKVAPISHSGVSIDELNGMFQNTPPTQKMVRASSFLEGTAGEPGTHAKREKQKKVKAEKVKVEKVKAERPAKAKVAREKAIEYSKAEEADVSDIKAFKQKKTIGFFRMLFTEILFIIPAIGWLSMLVCIVNPRCNKNIRSLALTMFIGTAIVYTLGYFFITTGGLDYILKYIEDVFKIRIIFKLPFNL